MLSIFLSSHRLAECWICQDIVSPVSSVIFRERVDFLKIAVVELNERSVIRAA
jgi:hypothetical protein